MRTPKIQIDAARFGENGDVRRAYSLGALQLSERAPTVRTAEIDGRYYTVTSLGVQSAEAYELRHLHDGTGATGGEFAGRLVTRRGVEYRLHGPVKLVAAAAEAASAENAEAPAVLPCPLPLAEASDLARMEAERAQMKAAAQALVAQMQADVDAQIAAARARVEAATPEQLAQKRTPLPPLVEADLALDAAALDATAAPTSGMVAAPALVADVRGRQEAAAIRADESLLRAGYLPVEVDDAGQFDPHAYTTRVKAELQAARQDAPETHQAPAAAAETESAASDTPAPLCPGCDAPVDARRLWCDGCEQLKDQGLEPYEVHQARLAEAAEIETPEYQQAALDAAIAAFDAKATPARLVPVDRYPYDEIPLGWIVPSPHNPRTHIPDSALSELADSIRERGVLQPLRVRRLAEPAEGGELYELVAGERRWHAARIAGLTSVPVVLSTAQTEAEVRLEQLVENLQRADLSPLEVARGYQDMARLGMTQTQIAAQVGKSQPVIASYLGLLDLPADVQQLVVSGALKASHARALGRWDDYPEAQSAIARLAAANGATARYLERSPLPYADQLVEAGVVPPAPKPPRSREAVGAKGGSAPAAAPTRRAEYLPAAQIQAEQARVLAERRAAAEELREAVFTRIAPDDARAVAVIAEYVASNMQPAFLREAGAAVGIPEELLAETGLARPALWEHLAGLELPRVLEFALRLVVGRELYHAAEHGMPPRRCEWLAGRVEESAERTCRQCGDGASAEMAEQTWPLDDCCEPCAEELHRRGLLEEDGGEREALPCEACGERIGAHLAQCPLCQATAGVTEAVA
jgi:ParB/RepB/Spo0J family partition protein